MEWMKKTLFVMFIVFCMAGCSTVRTSNQEELRTVEQPSPANAAWVDSLAPLAVAWYSEQERVLLARGRPLDSEEEKMARQMGVQHPERVRVIVAQQFPFPDNPVLAEELRTLGFGSQREGGRSLGYAILIKPKYEKQRWLLAHELVHTAQRERLGTEPFIRRYLLELRILGHARAPLELEAAGLMKRIE